MALRLVDIDEMHLHVETENAILVSHDGDKDKAVWLPKSQVEFATSVRGFSQVVIVTLPEWLAKEKGLV